MHKISLPLSLACAVLLLAVAGAQGASSDVVISQVYGGGGNSGASYTNDYVELLNRGSSAVDLSSWSVQYATASGTTWQPTPLGSLFGRYLVQLASSAAGLAAADARCTGVRSPPGRQRTRARHDSSARPQAACKPSSRRPAGYGPVSDYEGSAVNVAPEHDGGAHGGATWTPTSTSDFAVGTPTPQHVVANIVRDGDPPAAPHRKQSRRRRHRAAVSICSTGSEPQRGTAVSGTTPSALAGT